jgi:spermidine/putrescine transport system permease protein
MKLVNSVLGAWTVLVLIFFYLPIAILVGFSFNTSRLNIIWEGFTLQWYSAIWHDAVLVASLNNSLIIAVISTVLAVVLGTGGAWLLYRYQFPAVRFVMTMVFIPMIIPEVIMGVSLLILFVTIHLELGFTTIIISHVTFCFPFVMVAVQARLSGLDPSLEEAAMDLGATPALAFRRVLIPFLMPAIISGALMAFTLSLDELIVTYFTASARTRTLPLEIFGRVKKGLDPTLNAISTVFIASTVVLVIATEILRVVGRLQHRRATEFTASDDEHVFIQIAVVNVGDQ